MKLSVKGTSTALGLILSLSPAIHGVAHADPSASPAGLSARVLVEGKLIGSPTAPSVEQAEKKIRKAPGGVELVPQEAFDKSFALNLQDMLANVPGVFARQRFAEEVRLSIRGSGLSRSFHMRGITLLQDGMPITLADNSSDFQEVDPLSLRYVEVYKGANALRYGAANLGGAVNFVMPTGRTATAPVIVSLEGGSFDTLRGHGSYAYADEKMDAFVAATGTYSAGYRDHDTMKNGRLFGNVGFALNDSAETRFYLAYNNINQELPGSLSYDQALTNPESVLPNILTGDQARDIQSLRFSNRTVISLSDSTLTIGAYGTYKKLYHPIFQVIDQNTFEYGLYGEVETPFSVSDHDGSVTLGVRAGQGKTDAKQYVNIGGKRGALTAMSDQRATNIQAYADGRIAVVPNVSLIAGAQFVHATRNYDNRLNPALSADTDFDSLSPKFGLLWDVTENAQVFANVSRSYEVPTYSELVQSPIPGFVPLEAQKAWTAEIGTRGKAEVGGALWAWDVALYRASVRNELLQFTVNADIPAATFNADKTLHQGIEAGVTVTLLDSLTLRQTYSFNDFKFVDDAQYGDNAIAGIPKHLYRAELNYTAGGFHVTPSVDWAISKAWVDFANTKKTPRYAVFNLSTGYDFENGLSVYAEGSNLFDKRYISNFGTLTDARLPIAQNNYYPGEGRAVFVGLKWAFGK